MRPGVDDAVSNGEAPIDGGRHVPSGPMRSA